MTAEQLHELLDALAKGKGDEFLKELGFECTKNDSKSIEWTLKK